ncbi:MAG TPA: alpha/beta hydrolase [Anaerolineales bacterium]|nr:alpha/beta hydrolase [Anaerolineales bacterium]
MAAFTGFSSNGIPYARISDAGPALVVFTGSELEHKPPSWTARQGFLVGLKRLTQNYTVYLMSRKPDMPKDYTAQDMSNDFAEMIRRDIGTPVHILGMSSGGSSAMHFAVDHAHLVNKLALAMTAYQLNENGKRVAAIWRDLALAGDWPALYRRMGVDVAEGGTPEWVTRLMMRLFGKMLLGTPKSGSDFAIVLDSDINLDVVDKLPLIDKPTLVIGGENDPFYGADNIRETARLIPNAELCLLKNGGHAVVKTQTKAFEAAIFNFLQGKTEALANHAEANVPEPA